MISPQFIDERNGKHTQSLMKRIQIILFFLTGFFGINWCQAQEILFVESAHVQQVMEQYGERYKENPEVPGYRIQYLFTTDRRQMENVERKFDLTYYYIPHEWEHDQPYYRLYAGSFVTRSKAMQLLTEIRKNFPEALLVNATVPIDKVLECRQKLLED